MVGMEKYLKEESYYGDIYDLGTIERCLRVIDFWKNKVKDDYFKGKNEQAEAEVRQLGAKAELYFIQGERFKERESTLKEWMEKDRRLDEAFEQAKESQGIRCLNCLAPMKVISKDLWDRTG
jgi:hypothetical protein